MQIYSTAKLTQDVAKGKFYGGVYYCRAVARQLIVMHGRPAFVCMSSVWYPPKFKVQHSRLLHMCVRIDKWSLA